ncbi:MAG: pyrroline-5-carboxylate reductase [Flavobacteriaceae bacterium]
MSEAGSLRVLLVGAGKMGGAMLGGWLANGIRPENVTVLDPGPPPEMAALIAEKGIALNPDTSDAPDVAVVAVKPQVMDEVLPKAVRHFGPRTLLVSVAAGKTIANLARHAGSTRPIVRAMPNTPAAIGRGMSVLVANDHASPAERETATRLLSACGKTAWIEDEALMDAVTAVSGSGPAYVFHLAECMAKAGEAAGLDPELAMLLARETVQGAGELLHQSPEEPATLRKNVTSPGGTTAAALSVLMGDDGLEKLMREAVAAAKKRGQELGG